MEILEAVTHPKGDKPAQKPSLCSPLCMLDMVAKVLERKPCFRVTYNIIFQIPKHLPKVFNFFRRLWAFIDCKDANSYNFIQLQIA